MTDLTSETSTAPVCGETFLQRRQRRLSSRELTQQIVLGYGFGFILLIFGAFKYYLSVGSWDALWLPVMIIGGCMVVVTLIAPFMLQPVDKLLRFVGNAVGHKIMLVILAVLYYVLIFPVGALLRLFKGSAPIYKWDRGKPPAMVGWHKKELPADVAEAQEQGRGRKSKSGMLKVVVFFARTGKVLFIPVLLILISLGVALFFLQSSIIAPFIYTLF